jgi:hypothetical protein
MTELAQQLLEEEAVPGTPVCEPNICQNLSCQKVIFEQAETTGKPSAAKLGHEILPKPCCFHVKSSDIQRFAWQSSAEP